MGGTGEVVKESEPPTARSTARSLALHGNSVARFLRRG
jgi:hypothetical protein